MWRDIQNSSKDLRKAAALMEAGKNKHKKDKRNTDVSRYLRYCTLDNNGLMISKTEDKSQPFLLQKQKRIVIPREFSYTYVTILHKKFNNPNKSQIMKMFNRQFYKLNAEEVISKVAQACVYPCQAIKKIPKEAYDYQVETKPTIAGTFFNADVLQEACQKILILRDNLTSFTDAMVIKNETISTMRDALMILISRLRIDQKVTVRVDAHSTLKALQKDQILRENTPQSFLMILCKLKLTNHVTHSRNQ